MRKLYTLKIEIPEKVNCEVNDGILKCKKEDILLERAINLPRTKIKVENGNVVFLCEKANKKNISIIKTHSAHIKNLFKGFDEKFIYEMEVCNVHFPMNVKVEGNKLVISNFLGEKEKRIAKILDGVNIEIKGNLLKVSGHDIEKTGQTAGNIEKASRVTNKDRRIFQDGIFLVSKHGRDI